MVAIMLAEGFKEHCVTLHQVLLNCGSSDKTIKCKCKKKTPKSLQLLHQMQVLVYYH